MVTKRAAKHAPRDKDRESDAMTMDDIARRFLSTPPSPQKAPAPKEKATKKAPRKRQRPS